MRNDELDLLTIDAMVRGDDATPEAWTRLIAHPAGARIWADATARRAQVDALARIIAYPWIAALRGQLRSIREQMSMPSFSVTMWPRSALLNAVLGPASMESAQVLPISWGSLSVHEIPLGETVYLRADSPGQIQVFVVTAQGSQRLPAASWELEAGESPVVLLATQSSESIDDLRSVLDTARPVAGVVLLEKHPT
jgi:hypothetical protein